MDTFISACNVLKAGYWELFCAHWFGKKCITQDDGCTVTMSLWRGKFYLIDVQHSKQNAATKGG